MSEHLSFTAHRDAIGAGRFVRVVNYHSTSRAERHLLRDELAALLKTHDAVSFAELDAFFETGRWASERPGFFPVFYEGYRTSYDVAAPVCDELGISAWFPICTGFVDTPVAEQEVFARSHYIGLVAEDIAMHGERLALTWDEIGELAQRHTVTPHTASHYGINDIATEVARLTMDQIEQIAKLKMTDLNAKDLSGAVRIIMGSARSLGIEVI